MDIAMVGLGRMGMNMAKRLLGGGHRVVVYNRTPDKIDDMVAGETRCRGSLQPNGAKRKIISSPNHMVDATGW